MPVQSNAPHTLLTAEEVARLLRVKPATVYQAASEGRLPCVRLWAGKRKTLVRFRLDVIQQVIQERSFPLRPEGR